MLLSADRNLTLTQVLHYLAGKAFMNTTASMKNMGTYWKQQCNAFQCIPGVHAHSVAVYLSANLGTRSVSTGAIA